MEAVVLSCVVLIIGCVANDGRNVNPNSNICFNIFALFLWCSHQSNTHKEANNHHIELGRHKIISLTMTFIDTHPILGPAVAAIQKATLQKFKTANNNNDDVSCNDSTVVMSNLESPKVRVACGGCHYIVATCDFSPSVVVSLSFHHLSSNTHTCSR
jgi:hypothetical protein